MYCILKYIDYLDYKRFQDESTSTLKSLHSVAIDPCNSTLYFNPNCILQLIMDYLCAVLHIDIDGDWFDMCNEYGDLLNIKDYKSTTSGLTIFRPRETYYIVIIARNAAGTQIENVSLMLNPNSELYENLLKKLKKKLFPPQRSPFVKRQGSSKNNNTVTPGSNTSARRRSSAHI